MRVKICGIRELGDAYAAIDAGADALGFVFYDKSPRYLDAEEAKELIAKLPPFVERVGLFVNEEAKIVDEICSFCNISLAQIHFEAKPSFYEKLKTKHVKVVRAAKKEDIYSFADEYRLVDSFVESYGGAGKRLNLEWFEGIDTSKTVIAGGLTSENLAELKGFGFYGVDVSSGVESAPGIKDKAKIREFVLKAKHLH
ncbi:MAG: phosphoribosylanthranilate isomerase [Campylobacteraceae bacterium]|nr:phosphoribosylanthranilate isomerase [Campylobacteraceae bacterium]